MGRQVGSGGQTDGGLEAREVRGKRVQGPLPKEGVIRDSLSECRHTDGHASCCTLSNL